jgi:hypothetical protein
MCEGDPLGALASWPDSWSAQMQIRETIDSAEPYATFTSSDMLTLDTVDTVVDGVTTSCSRVSIYIPAATSSAWAWTAGVWDLELHGPDDRVIRLAAGKATLDAEVTRVV